MKEIDRQRELYREALGLLGVGDGLQNDQTRELVREIKRATGQRKN